MPLLFNMLSWFVIAFLPRSKHPLISWLQSPATVILEPKKIKSVTISIVSSSICSITSRQIVAETTDTATDFIFLGSKITADGDYSHEINRPLLLERKAMTSIDSILKSRDITLLAKFHLVRAMVFQLSCMDVRVGL